MNVMSRSTSSTATESHSLSVTTARQRILERIAPLQEHEQVSLPHALDRILAENVTVPFDLPPYDHAAMDGYAVCFDSLTPQTDTLLRVVGHAYAGHPFGATLTAGQAVRIMTGAVLPHGADTVVMQETAHCDGDSVRISSGQRRGQHVRRRGEDMRAGDVALPAGKCCGAAELGVLASLGLDSVNVYRRLRVAFFSSGDELTAPGEPLSPGRIYDSNRYTLLGALRRLGCEVIDLGMLRDDPQQLEKTLLKARDEADAIVTSGGISVGEADFVRLLLSRLGEVEFWRLDMKPGRPFAFGKIGDRWIFGLPGNPVATLVAFYQLVRDALLRQAGMTPLPEPVLLSAIAQSDIGKSAGKREFVRGCYDVTDGVIQVAPAGKQGSGMLKSLSRANCFIVLPETGGAVKAGENVLIQPFAGLI